MPSDGLFMPSILLSTIKEPLDRPLIIVVFPALEFSMMMYERNVNKIKYGRYLLATINDLVPAVLGELSLGEVAVGLI